MKQNLLHSFNQFLDLDGVSENTKKNYSADIRHFYSWLKETRVNQTNTEETIMAVDRKTIKEYINWLQQHHLPKNQINRKLSSLRKFFNFALNQQWIQTNPTKGIKNITTSQTKKVNINSSMEDFTIPMILKIYAKALYQDKASNTTVKNYLSDTQQFLSWLERETTVTKNEVEVNTARRGTSPRRW